jgi:hypothetical protein
MGKKARLKMFININRFFLLFSFLILTFSPAEAQTPSKASRPALTQAATDRYSSEFETLYPGVYIEREKVALEKLFAEMKSWETRGEIDIQALIAGTLPKDTPGVGPTIKVTEAMVRYQNQKYDPDNRVLNDSGYAKKLGYMDIFPFLSFVGYDDFFLTPYPTPARDTMFPSDLNHSITSYRPVYPGDTLYLVYNSGRFTDITPPEGSKVRTMAQEIKGSVYNQKGEKVSDVIYRTTRNMKIYKTGKTPKSFVYFDAPDWMIRPVHYYTDDDWAIIKDIWSKEKRQGSTPLYWEDVKIGDEPAWTMDGPIDESVTPTAPIGMGTGGSRTMRKEIMDPNIFKTMIRSEKDGIYRLPNKADYIPTAPDAKAANKADNPTSAKSATASAGIHDITESGRAILINYMGRDFAIRHINNWMGDYGWIQNIRWSIMPSTAHAAFGRTLPNSPYSERFLEKVPKMKGRSVTVHGLTGDAAIVKSYVYDKYVTNGEFLVELVWWVETIDGYIWQEGGATIRLPSKNAN